MNSGVNDTVTQNLVEAFQKRQNGILEPVLNTIDWIPEAVSEINGLINAADKIEICNPTNEVRNIPISKQVTRTYAFITITDMSTGIIACHCAGYPK